METGLFAIMSRQINVSHLWGFHPMKLLSGH